jgi:hypothetical protein
MVFAAVHRNESRRDELAKGDAAKTTGPQVKASVNE